MKLIRMFSKENVKGKRNYINSQKGYEILRTVLYFVISIALFVAGWIQTGSRENLLTIVAVLGCLPACKSVVETIMYLRFHSCNTENANQIVAHIGELSGMFDVVFTSYDKNFMIDHLTVRGNTICGFSSKDKFEEQAFSKHLDTMLKKDCFKDTSIKIFTDIKKYTERLEQMKELPEEKGTTEGILATIRNITL